jgi:hypothetical protein
MFLPDISSRYSRCEAESLEVNYYYYYRISHFSALAGKYSPTLGFSNQQD